MGEEGRCHVVEVNDVICKKNSRIFYLSTSGCVILNRISRRIEGKAVELVEAACLDIIICFIIPYKPCSRGGMLTEAFLVK